MSSQISYLFALVVALIVPVAQSVPLGIAMSATSLLVSQAPVQARSTEAVGRLAKAITVRIEGATQGSGVLVKREGNRYTVLTAWHVVRSQGPREELDVYTSDGRHHLVEPGSIKRLGEVDLAVLTFSSSAFYELARIGDVKNISSGSSIYVSGFPLPTSAVPMRLYRFLDGRVIANATVYIPNGYQLLYSNPTLPGMSGGAVLSLDGQLVGIHGQAETDIEMTEQYQFAVKTGTSQAVPVSYYTSAYRASNSDFPSSTYQSSDDYLVQLHRIWEDYLRAPQGRQDLTGMELRRLSSASLRISQTSHGYSYLSIALSLLKDYKAALRMAEKAQQIDGGNVNAYLASAVSRESLGDLAGAFKDLNKVIKLNPYIPVAYSLRGYIREELLGDLPGSLADFSRSIELDSKNPSAYVNRARLRRMDDPKGACDDYSVAAKLGNSYARSIISGKSGGDFAWCASAMK